MRMHVTKLCLEPTSMVKVWRRSFLTRLRSRRPAAAPKPGLRGEIDTFVHIRAVRARLLNRLVLLAALIAATASCGDVARQGRAPVFLVIDRLEASRGPDGEFVGTLLSDVITNITTPAPCTETAPCPTVFNDSGRVTLRLVLKDLGTPTAPSTISTNNEVTITRYRVSYRRADGRNTPGVDVPYGFDGAVTGTVAAASSIALTFELVRHVAKVESPLVQLKTNPTIIATIADVSFFGVDRVGNDVSAAGALLIEFGNFGD